MTLDLSRPVRLGTRGSELALWQSNHVRDRLRAHHGERLVVELVTIATEGDRVQDRPLHEVGGKGLFVKAIEQKLLEGEIDLAVHSMKDLPARLPPGLVVACTPEREDPRDALVSRDGNALAALPPGAKVGTGSLRRGALVHRIAPQVEVVPIRGNVPTRLRKVGAELDAVILAAAGLHRLGLGDTVSEYLDPPRFCPAPAQGILALECRDDDAWMQAILAPLENRTTRIQATAERAFLVRLEAGCTVPVGCHAVLLDNHRLRVHGLVVHPTGDPIFEDLIEGSIEDASKLGRTLAETLLHRGADTIVDATTP